MKEEVWNALCFMKPFKPPGMDGFQPFFFKQYSHIVGDDVWNLVKRAFEFGCFDPRLAEMLTILIPNCG